MYAAHKQIADAAKTGALQSLTDRELDVRVQPLTIYPRPKKVRAWVRFGPTAIRVDAQLVRSTPLAAGIEFHAEDQTYRCWAWGNAMAGLTLAQSSLQSECPPECPRTDSGHRKSPDFPVFSKEVGAQFLAVTVGFEPTVGGYPTQLFESCTFGRSDTSPSFSLRQVNDARESGVSSTRPRCEGPSRTTPLVRMASRRLSP